MNISAKTKRGGNWKRRSSGGRYAELFDYDAASGKLTLTETGRPRALSTSVV